MKVLITGGAGYIGSTVASACEDAGHEVVLLDDFSTGRREFVRAFPLYEGSISDRALLDRLFAEEKVDAVVHCAAWIVVPESVSDPLGYYANNVGGSVTLLQAMVAAGVARLVFSSSASVYGHSDDLVVSEDAPLRPDSPYASSKAMMERIMADAACAGLVRCIALRYFNPVGADPQLRTGQQLAEPSHVVGMMTKALYSGGTFTVTGTDWPTRDGTGLRDFIHVWDLAQAHVAALERFEVATENTGFIPINIGTGRGTTVRELLNAFEAAAGRGIHVTDGPRRPGDVAGACASAERARVLLGWEASVALAMALRDHLRWQDIRPSVLGC